MIQNKILNQLQKGMLMYLNNFHWNILSSLAETSDKFLKIGVHVLKNQVEYCLAFFVQALFDIHQSTEKNNQSNKIYFSTKDKYKQREQEQWS